MQTATLKVDIISWISGLTDKRLLEDLHRLSAAKHTEQLSSLSGFIPPKRAGKLTEGFGIWSDNPMENTTDWRT